MLKLYSRKLTCARAFSVSLLSIILLSSTVISEQEANYQYKQVDPCEFYQQLEFDGNLAYDSVVYQTSLGPRLPGSNASAELRSSITENLTEWNFEEDSHLRENFTLTNLIGKYSPENSTGDNVFLVAHYDSRFAGDRDDNESLANLPILGANDGASGVAVLIELGKIIPTMNLTHDVTLFFTDAEDQGTYGSTNTWSYGAQAYVENLTQEEISNITAYVVIDMIGDEYLDFTKVTSTSETLWQTIDQLAISVGLVEGEQDCSGNSGLPIYDIDAKARGVIDDHVPAHQAGIPAVNLIDINYGPNASAFGGYWHTHDDTNDKVSSQSLQHIGNLLELGLRSSTWNMEIYSVVNQDNGNQTDANNSTQADNQDKSQQQDIAYEKNRYVGLMAISIVGLVFVLILMSDIAIKF